MTTAGKQHQLATYELPDGTARALIAQRINGRVAITDLPLQDSGRVYLVERHIESQAAMAGLTRAGKPDLTVIADACAYAWLQLVRRPDVALDNRGFAWLRIAATQEAWRLTRRPERPCGLHMADLDRDSGELPEPAGLADDPFDLARLQAVRMRTRPGHRPLAASTATSSCDPIIGPCWPTCASPATSNATPTWSSTGRTATTPDSEPAGEADLLIRKHRDGHATWPSA